VTFPDTFCHEWLRTNGFIDEYIDEKRVNAGSAPPDQSVYSPIQSPRLIVIHHSATRTGNAKLFRCLHRVVNGWEDIGYHFVIGNGTYSDDGLVEQGRPLNVMGAHARDHNHNSIGICLVGDFEEESPTTEQMKALGKLLGELLSRFGLSGKDIRLHRQLKGCRTVCPGKNLGLDEVLVTLSGSAS
jgi:N-acetylmuramoyl-L-alanine amidase